MSVVRLSDEHLIILLLLLRNSTRPMSTAELVQALRDRAAR